MEEIKNEATDMTNEVAKTEEPTGNDYKSKFRILNDFNFKNLEGRITRDSGTIEVNGETVEISVGDSVVSNSTGEIYEIVTIHKVFDVHSLKPVYVPMVEFNGERRAITNDILKVIKKEE
jgi:hypothetical protein